MKALIGMADLVTEVKDQGARYAINLLLEGKRVSGAAVVKKQMQIGRTLVRMGGIAGVWTDANYRMKGYASRAMWESIALMEREYFDVSILFGIRNFYDRYGYSEAFAEQALSIETAALSTLKGTYRARMYKAADLGALVRLYRQYNAGRTGMDARRAVWKPRWRMPRMGEGTTRRPGKVLVVCDGKDRVCGFAVFDAQAARLVVAEICGKNREALVSLGCTLARRARRIGADQIRFHLPSDDPFVAICVPLGCTTSASYSFNAGSMGRIILLDRLFHKLQGELSERWRASDLDWDGHLRLDTDVGSVGLQVGSSGVKVNSIRRGSRVTIPQMALMQLVMGYRTVDDVAYDDGVKIPKRLISVLNALFPKGNPYMWWTDRF